MAQGLPRGLRVTASRSAGDHLKHTPGKRIPTPVGTKMRIPHSPGCRTGRPPSSGNIPGHPWSLVDYVPRRPQSPGVASQVLSKAVKPRAEENATPSCWRPAETPGGSGAGSESRGHGNGPPAARKGPQPSRCSPAPSSPARPPTSWGKPPSLSRAPPPPHWRRSLCLFLFWMFLYLYTSSQCGGRKLRTPQSYSAP